MTAQTGARHAGPLPLPRPLLMLVTEPADELEEIVAEAVAGGVNAVQLRDKAAPEDRLREIATGLRRITRGRALFLVNAFPSLARAVDADGVHLPEAGPPPDEARRIAGALALVGRSVHSPDSARRAAPPAGAASSRGADYLVAGTVFASASHPDAAPAGLDFLRAVCAAVSVPVLAIGGITPQNLGQCLRAGAAGVAALSPLMRASDPRAAARLYRAALDTAWRERNNENDRAERER